MKVLVTGATGFVGPYVVDILRTKVDHIRCFVWSEDRTTPLPTGNVEIALGTLDDPASLEKAMDSVDLLVNVASLGFGHAPNIVGAAVESGIKRAVFVSTTAIFTKLNPSSKTIRLQAEKTIRESGLNYTIIRPTMIYGSSRDRNMCRLVNLLRRSPIIPVIGSGNYLQQPVYVEDVARAIVDAVLSETTIGKAYNIAGKRELTFNQVIDTACELLGRRVHKLHIPNPPTLLALDLLERLSIKLPIKAEQIRRLNENKNFDYSEAARDFDYAPLSYKEGLRLELLEMGLSPRERNR